MSTPIETNTEELQEILNTVYNLPMAGGGSSEPDLIIGINVENHKMFPDGSSAPCRSLNYMTLDDVSILSGSVSATAEKVRQGLPVKVLLNEVHFYWSNRWHIGVGEASNVQLMYNNEYPNEENPGLAVSFFLCNAPSGGIIPCFMKIMFDVTTENAYSYDCVQL